MSEINWQEVATETAENLGWTHVPSTKGSLDHWKKDIKKPEYFKAERLTQEIFSWPSFGLMLEKAHEVDWDIQIRGDSLLFIRFRSPLRGPEDETFDRSIKDHGHIKACALAFKEIFRVGK